MCNIELIKVVGKYLPTLEIYFHLIVYKGFVKIVT